jgi:hypothetical protein
MKRLQSESWVSPVSAFFESLLKYIQQSEKLIVVTLTFTLAGVALFIAEDWVFNYDGLPEWARPLALIVWTVCAAHVVIRTVMSVGRGLAAASRFIVGIPQRRRQAAYDQHLIDRLLTTDGVEREMLCYALHRDENHIWVGAARQRPRWLIGLRQKGLLEFDNATWGPAHFRIHPVAWRYMKKHPNKFINLLKWADWPWTMNIDEGEIEKKITALKKERATWKAALKSSRTV